MRLNITHTGLVRQITSQAVITSPCTGKSVDVIALWDTGATRSHISGNIAKDLQLKEAGFVPVKHMAGTGIFPRYVASINIQGGLIINKHKLGTFPNIHEFDMIIGMDIISLGRFCIENRDGNSVFSFRY